MSDKTKLYLNIVSLDRAIQTELLLESILKYWKSESNRFDIVITVYFNHVHRPENIFHRNYNNLKEKYKSIADFVEVPAEELGNITGFENSYNLTIPANTVFTRSFDMEVIDTKLNENTVIDLFKGIDRQYNLLEDSFIFNASSWDKTDHRKVFKMRKNYSKDDNPIEKEYETTQIFIEPLNPVYGKIYYKNGNETQIPEDVDILFFSLSPAFINCINFVEEVDDSTYKDFAVDEYNCYALGLRALFGESIDQEPLEGFSPNSLYFPYRYTFKKNTNSILQ